MKMSATGNDFVVLDFRRSVPMGRSRLSKLAVSLCDRKLGVGADGLLVIEPSRKADFKMRIFNRDGSEAEMCGNGLRCVALYGHSRKKNLKIETRRGLYGADITGRNKVKIKMEEPRRIKRDLPIKLNNRFIKVNYIDTGVPHAVVFVQGLDKIDIESIGKDIRYHKRFRPRGTNVDFVEIIDDKNIKMRTYERGVEGETLACGTGAVAAAIVTNHESRTTNHEINVHAKGGTLKIYFKNINGKIKDVYLEGEVKHV